LEYLVMAQRTITVDDIDGTSPAEEVPFSVGTDKWLIDLTGQNKDALLGALAPFIAKARRAPTPSKGHRSGRARQVRLSAEETTRIRTWAAEQGQPVAERGPLPADVVNAYNEAHPAA
jgi:hypothetical protein